jgi:hypothetical protein
LLLWRRRHEATPACHIPDDNQQVSAMTSKRERRVGSA